jgi:hypothetical protein
MLQLQLEVPPLPGASFEARLAYHERQLRRDCREFEAAKRKAAQYKPEWELVMDRESKTASILPEVVCISPGGKFHKALWAFTRRGQDCGFDPYHPSKCKDHRHFEAEVLEPFAEGMQAGDRIRGFFDQVMPGHRLGKLRITRETCYVRVRMAHYGFHSPAQGCPPEEELNLFG